MIASSQSSGVRQFLDIKSEPAKVSDRIDARRFFVLCLLACAPLGIGPQLSTLCSLNGRVHMTNNQGRDLIPTSGMVYVIYAGASGNDSAEKTAGFAYDSELLKVAKAFVKETAKHRLEAGTEPEHRRRQLLETDYLQTVDSALASATRWARKHKMQWQFISVKVRADGTWSANDLRPGHYKVIARGILGNVDAEWGTGDVSGAPWGSGVQVSSGQTVSVDLDQVNMANEISSN